MLHSRFWQAFFALAPLFLLLVVLVGYFAFILATVARIPDSGWESGEPPWVFFGGLGISLVLLFLVVILSLASLVFYIVHAAQNPNLRESNMLVVWILLFVFANGLGQLIYWILEILNKRHAGPP